MAIVSLVVPELAGKWPWSGWLYSDERVRAFRGHGLEVARLMAFVFQAVDPVC